MTQDPNVHVIGVRALPCWGSGPRGPHWETDVTDHVAGGSRRIDRVLAEDYLDGLPVLPMDKVRSLRADAEQEETDLSYLRRLVQGRMDIIGAELNRRAGNGGSLVDELPRILADEVRSPSRGLGRHATYEPSRVDSHRRHLEALVADVGLSDMSTVDDAGLRSLLETLQGEEASVSRQRRAVQSVADSCSAEITRRYRDGEADVATLLDQA